MWVLVNPAAGGGRGLARWRRVERELRARGVPLEPVFAPDAAAARAEAERAIARGERTLVAAGGDGTVRLLLDAILARGAGGPGGVRLGAIGLGSSNDFHKAPASARIAGLPARLDERAARLFDAGRAAIEPPGGGARAVHHFAIGASLGIIAEGNDFFNGRDPVLRALKRLHTEAAILYATAASLARHRPLELDIAVDGAPPERAAVAALHVIKRPCLAGGMRYDGLAVDDGVFGLCIYERMSRAAIVATILAAYRGRVRERPGVRFRTARRVEVRPLAPAPVELDGEVHLAARAELEVLPGAILVCG